MPSLEQHEYLWDTPVREIEGKENLGFLLASSGAVMAPVFWAHYADGLIEAIDPPSGFPRPEPDPADRTKRVVIPTSLRTRQPNVLQKQGSRYSGQMRRVVQCLNSRGLESPFLYGWPKTHGILEYPYPRQLGSTAGEEAQRFAQRRFWIIEISASGVYAAPIIFGLQCMTCASNLSEFKSDDVIDLAWAYGNNNAKVLRVMDAASIAPAYANGGPWYTGMGWAFSWSGKSASNVVQRERTLPSHYETRLIDLEFSVAFTEAAAPISLTALNGVATALMPGHGFTTGDLASISGAAIDAYNGAHIVTVLDGSAFTFAIAPGTASPAGGTPMVANANGTATISATLTVGSIGKVTFRINDLGTLWVPGTEQPTRWDGIKPYSHFNCSGPVHVFYDGEEKIVTNWSCASSTIPLDQVLTPHPQPASEGGPIPAGVDPNTFWAGVTFGFHYWAGPYEYLTPYPQDANAVPYPDHPCSYRIRPYVLGSGHSYSSYVNLSWGFSGPFSHAVNAYSRTRIETESHWDGDHVRDPGFDYSYNGGYIECGSSPPKSCAATFKFLAYTRKMVKTTASTSEGASGSSALFLFPLDREAVGGVRRTSSTFATTNTAVGGNFRYSKIEMDHTVHTEGCAIENLTIENAGLPFVGPVQNTGNTNTSSATKSFAIRASGGINISGSVAGASPDLDPFIVYQAGVKEQADSSILLMRGGLEYPDAGLMPGSTNQIRNHVRQLDGYTLSGGFAALPAGRDPVAFIGQV